MNIIERAGEIVRHPDNEWAEIAEERTSLRDLCVSYAAPLAAIPAVASLLGMTITGFAGLHLSFGAALSRAVVWFLLDLTAVYAAAVIAVRLAPAFGGRKDRKGAAPLSVYSFTPIWLCGVVNLIPAIGLLQIAGYGYAALVMSRGAESLMGVPASKALSFAAAVVGAVFVAVFILHHLISALIGIPVLV